jgi:hypothetical protein
MKHSPREKSFPHQSGTIILSVGYMFLQNETNIITKKENLYPIFGLKQAPVFPHQNFE